MSLQVEKTEDEVEWKLEYLHKRKNDLGYVLLQAVIHILLLGQMSISNKPLCQFLMME